MSRGRKRRRGSRADAGRDTEDDLEAAGEDPYVPQDYGDKEPLSPPNRDSSSVSLEPDKSTALQRDPQLNIHNLSFILHPCHEPSSPDQDTQSPNAEPAPAQQQPALLTRAVTALGLTDQSLQTMIKTYFDNMVAINLFHEPTFSQKLNTITTATQAKALLAAMMGYTAKFTTLDEGANKRAKSNLSAHYVNLALSFATEALHECGDEEPPLCILQAFIVLSHCQLTEGVRGKSWRSLGTCVRLAYEMNLHLVDTETMDGDVEVDAAQWCKDEEKRRAWWAVWEMDVFATTIRRTPTAIEWGQIETLLPVDDIYWFQNRPHGSCFFLKEPLCRWKTLQESGLQSAKAWYIVINSLMKDAQQISSPRGVYKAARGHRDPPRDSNSHAQARQNLEALGNLVHCLALALPEHLRFRNQPLGFEGRENGQITSARQLHCSIYNIYVMQQLARLMIYRYAIFARQTQDASFGKNSNRAQGENIDMDSFPMRQYFDAANNILNIVVRSCEDHIQHINPFLSSTIWLAAAIQLVHRGLSRTDDANARLIQSRFEVLHLTYKKCVSFWNIQTAMQQNLEALEAQLESSQASARDNNPENNLAGYDKQAFMLPSGASNNHSYPQAPNDELNGCVDGERRLSHDAQRRNDNPAAEISHFQSPPSTLNEVACDRGNDTAFGTTTTRAPRDTETVGDMIQPPLNVPVCDTFDVMSHLDDGLIEPLLFWKNNHQSLIPQVEGSGRIPDAGGYIDWRDMGLPSDIQSLLIRSHGQTL
ncbi:fungal specific transcription factor domain-containing protein [Aspergillus fischeri NRRL 181]|uniref:Fungal specific transcription factor, putative n=1 Tax=Neosartorya fischeri (strain ATCC 1020 / DSM 3700 / CBS 544.65 / FGSC A1164 / JCM 1740 / NRRL 181 / WB 181) TaxID=331117 RepID=A1DKS2_NEOFI|nr:fungal specific transcription factor, putative [Aspergillus fischeri NRRL 181]EAW15393.1 fungal specific transcription factor, putative [Aspergillus fischeri NRRL 181]KAG2016889.1 hypothetical protein GB937_006092 [Aspergillus fischeri]